MTITPGVLGDWLADVAPYTDGTAPASWTTIRGITELTPPQLEKNLEDDGEFDGTHWGSQTATGISWTAEATVKTPRAGLPRDPGQEILKAASRDIAEGGLVHVRFYQRGSTPKAGDQGIADVQYMDNGGPKTDITTAALTLTGRGALVEFTEATETWAATTAYTEGDLVKLSGGQSLEALTSGTSGATEPTAPATVGDTVVDGSVAWKRTA